MPIALFEHNQAAYEYEVVKEMLETAGNACVVHPTRTGKSFIAFKYCEDCPEETILWLSPFSYIFRTQCENLAETGTSPFKSGAIEMDYQQLDNLLCAKRFSQRVNMTAPADGNMSLLVSVALLYILSCVQQQL